MVRLMRLEARTAFVTGGASGIGAATARRLAAEGARVAIGDLDEAGARDVAAEIDGFACALDVADAASARAALAAAAEALGPVDVLVNNAGTDRFAFFVNTDEALWDFVLGVNLRGTIAVTHAVLDSMQKRGAGAIVNVASEAGRVGSQGSVVYSAAKAGVIGFTRHLALEVGADGITVNAVAPGTTATERVLRARTPEDTRRVAEAIPVKRLGEPAEIAEAVAFLASDAAAFINGATLDVNGGQVMA
jgi:2-hydroxycyclohexanecarboxyl-CoA dehydrogenase